MMVAGLFAGTSAKAQQTPKKALKKIMELKMPKTADDDMPGTRGAGVAWHPIQKKYYANFAGNVGYPSAVFNATGKRLSSDDAETMVDTRGIWYNPQTKAIEGNQYDIGGWFRYQLDSKGLITDYSSIQTGMVQPTSQVVGTLNTKTKKVVFLKGSELFFYSFSDTISTGNMVIHFGITKQKDIMPDEDATAEPEGYNYTSVIYTGIANAEYGFLNTMDNQVELYSEKTGLLTKIFTLPADATAEGSFNFAYANGIYWLFDMKNRKWVGYK